MNEQRYLGLSPTLLNFLFFAVVAALAVGGVFAAGGPSSVVDEARQILGLANSPSSTARSPQDDTPAPQATPPPCEQLAVGCDAVVVNTGTWLNARTIPTTSGLAIGRLKDGVVTLIVGGPTVADGYTWWKTLRGWVAEGDVNGTKWLSPSPPTRPEIGPEVVWDALRVWLEQKWSRDLSLQRDLMACEGPDDECITAVMAKYGASSESIAFYNETGLFPSGFEETGKVDVVRTFDITRANSNDNTVLVNGSPRIIVADGIDVSSLAEHLFYSSIAVTTENFAFQFDRWLVDKVTSPSGGQTFVFDVPLTDGCHGCNLSLNARVGIDFASDGTYEGWHALEPSENPFSMPQPDLDPYRPEDDPCPNATRNPNGTHYCGVDDPGWPGLDCPSEYQLFKYGTDYMECDWGRYGR